MGGKSSWIRLLMACGGRRRERSQRGPGLQLGGVDRRAGPGAGGAQGMSWAWLSPRVELKILREDESLGNVL